MRTRNVFRGIAAIALGGVAAAWLLAPTPTQAFDEVDCSTLSYSIDPQIFPFKLQKCAVTTDAFQNTEATFEGMKVGDDDHNGMLLLRVTPKEGLLLNLNFAVQERVQALLGSVIPIERWSDFYYSLPRRVEVDLGIIELVNAIDDPKEYTCVVFEAYIEPVDRGYRSAVFGVNCAQAAKNKTFEQLSQQLKAFKP